MQYCQKKILRIEPPPRKGRSYPVYTKWRKNT